MRWTRSARPPPRGGGDPPSRRRSRRTGGRRGVGRRGSGRRTWGTRARAAPRSGVPRRGRLVGPRHPSDRPGRRRFLHVVRQRQLEGHVHVHEASAAGLEHRRSLEVVHLTPRDEQPPVRGTRHRVAHGVSTAPGRDVERSHGQLEPLGVDRRVPKLRRPLGHEGDRYSKLGFAPVGFGRSMRDHPSGTSPAAISPVGQRRNTRLSG